MRVRVDQVGRIVIPKPVRTALGLTPQTELELVTDGAGLRLDPVAPVDRTVEELDGFPLLGAIAGAVFDDDDVRRLRDDSQR